MFQKLIEKKQKIDTLKQNCFDTRSELIVTCKGSEENEKQGCIKLAYNIESGVLEAWRAGFQPEHTYRIVGPKVSYCFAFDGKNPTGHPCKNTDCPMYCRYQKYLQAVQNLQNAKSK